MLAQDRTNNLRSILLASVGMKDQLGLDLSISRPYLQAPHDRLHPRVVEDTVSADLARPQVLDRCYVQSSFKRPGASNVRHPDVF